MPWPFYAKKPLPQPEQVLYQRLVRALPGHTVLAGVALTEVLGVKRGFDSRLWSRRLGRLHYDFVVCAKDATVLAAIELDGADGSDGARNATRQFKQRASAAAGVRLIRWQTRALPDAAAIQEAFGELQMPVFTKPASTASAGFAARRK